MKWVKIPKSSDKKTARSLLPCEVWERFSYSTSPLFSSQRTKSGIPPHSSLFCFYKYLSQLIFSLTLPPRSPEDPRRPDRDLGVLDSSDHGRWGKSKSQTKRRRRRCRYGGSSSTGQSSPMIRLYYRCLPWSRRLDIHQGMFPWSTYIGCCVRRFYFWGCGLSDD